MTSSDSILVLVAASLQNKTMCSEKSLIITLCLKFELIGPSENTYRMLLFITGRIMLAPVIPRWGRGFDGVPDW